MPAPVSVAIDGGIATVRLDDGKVNAITHEVVAALDAHLADLAADASVHALLLAGRDGVFSAGFDLATMTAGPEPMRGLTEAGARLMMRLYAFPKPTVAACTGHALAGGALLLLCCDWRIGQAGAAKIGLNEVALGMGLPIFATELARDRLATSHFTRATMLAELYDPAGALAAGYLDEVVGADAATAARDRAGALATLRSGAVDFSKRNARRSTIDHVLATLTDDLATLTGPAGPPGA